MPGPLRVRNLIFELFSELLHLVLGSVERLDRVSGTIFEAAATQHDVDLVGVAKDVSDVGQLLLVELIDDVLAAQDVGHFLICHQLLLGRQANAIVDRLLLVGKFELHLAKIVVFLVDVLLRTDILQSLRILEHGFEYPLVVVQALLRQVDVNVKI